MILSKDVFPAPEAPSIADTSPLLKTPLTLSSKTLVSFSLQQGNVNP